MGMITDLFVASRDVVAELDLADRFPDHVPVYPCKNLDIVKLACLAAVDLGIPLDDTDAVVALIPGGEPLRMEGDGLVVVLELPAGLPERWRAWSDARIADLAAKWAASEELVLSGWDAATAGEVLVEVRDFLRDNLDKGEVFQLIVV